MNLRQSLIALALASGLASGCYTTNIYSGPPAAGISPVANNKVHHTLVFGLAEIADPVDLDGACQGGSWAQIREEMTFFNGFLSAISSQIYTPRTYTVMCTGGAGAAPAPAPAP